MHVLHGENGFLEQVQEEKEHQSRQYTETYFWELVGKNERMYRNPGTV